MKDAIDRLSCHGDQRLACRSAKSTSSRTREGREKRPPASDWNGSNPARAPRYWRTSSTRRSPMVAWRWHGGMVAWWVRPYHATTTNGLSDARRLPYLGRIPISRKPPSVSQQKPKPAHLRLVFWYLWYRYEVALRKGSQSTLYSQRTRGTKARPRPRVRVR